MEYCPFTSCIDPEKRDQRIKSLRIDKQLKKEKKLARRRQRVLLLGTAESGKSTFLKQMRIIHGERFREDEMLLFKLTIYQNIVKGMLLIMRQSKILVDTETRWKWQKKEVEEFVEQQLRSLDSLNSKFYALIMPLKKQTQIESNRNHEMEDMGLTEATVNNKEKLFMPLVPHFKKLWDESVAKFVFDNRHIYEIDDSVSYYMQNIDRIGSSGYTPSIPDIVHSRRKTIGILEHELLVSQIPFVFIDVGGQRTERDNWLKCFAGITAILFLASSSEFDQRLGENPKKNKMRESLEIFQTIVNNKILINVAIILFLNKEDVLKKKVSNGANIKTEFSQFKGNPSSAQDVLQFELSLFDEMRRDRSKPLFHHFTTAVNTDNIRVVFNAVKDTILQDNLNALMLH